LVDGGDGPIMKGLLANIYTYKGQER
jgi:hypothetical protein